MTSFIFVWMMVIGGGDSRGRTVGPFESEAACEQARVTFNQRSGLIREAGMCARVVLTTKEQK